MTSTVSTASLRQDIPLHTFRSGLQKFRADIPFVHLNFATAGALAQVTYPHRHNFYEILYITGGEGTHFIDFNAYPIVAGTVYFISPGQVHYWNTSVPIEGEIILFTEEFLLLAPSDYMALHEFSFFHSIEDTPALTLSVEERKLAESLIQSIADEYQAGKFRSGSVLRAYLHILLVEMQRICVAREEDAHSVNEIDGAIPNLVRHFKQLVAQQFTTEQSVQAYADQLGVTISHLNNIVKAVTGQTPGQLIRQEVVLEAKRLFTHTDLTSTEIGYRLSFDDPSYFGRFFKRETAMSTTQFRESIAESYQRT
ncbi:helix-turn-helix transcriptional regulator [Chloroflexi bacterium TSY]|nr:helix-turn-helix transcriptional regulator [Chloroflexi bacterium TSY]